MIAVLSLAQSAWAAPLTITIFSQNFDAQNAGVGTTNFNAFSNMSVTAGSVDLIGNGFADFLPGNGLYVDLDGSTNSAGRLQSNSLALAPGHYTLTFDLAGSQRTPSPTDKVDVSLGGAYTETFTLNNTDPFTTIVRNFDILVATNGNLVFDSNIFSPSDSDNRGLLLDNITLQFEAFAAPEPASVALWLLAGCGGFAGVVLRRRSVA